MALSYIKRFLRLYAGLFLCAVSIVLAIQGGVGVTPWDVFHMGIQNITGISYGTVNILVGLCILTTSLVLGEPHRLRHPVQHPVGGLYGGLPQGAGLESRLPPMPSGAAL